MRQPLVIVTGAAGFVGANLVRRLLAEGASVIAPLRDTTDSWRLPLEHDRLKVVRAALGELDSERLGIEPGSVECLFHLAAMGVNQSFSDVSAMIDSNVGGTLAALQLAERIGARRFLYVGSSGEYGPGVSAREDQVPAPNSEYGATKAAGWCLAHAFGRRTGLPIVSVRLFSVFGPFEAAYRLVPYCILRAIDGQAIEVTEGRQTRDYVFIDDVLEGLLAASRLPEAAGLTFNLSTGISTSVRDMVISIARLCGGSVQPMFGTRAPEKTEMWTTSGDPTLAERVLGWRATGSIDDGLKRTIAWLTENRIVYPKRYGT